MAEGFTIFNEMVPGPERVRLLTVAYLQSVLPTIIARYRTANDWTAWELPDIDRYETNEPRSGLGFGPDSNTLIVINMLDARGMQTLELDDLFAARMRTRYNMRVYTYAKAGNQPQPRADEPSEFGYNRACSVRDRLAACVRYALVDQPAMGDDAWTIDTTSLVESYSELQQARGDRWVGGVYHQFDLIAEETAVHIPIGEVETTEFEVYATQEITVED